LAIRREKTQHLDEALHDYGCKDNRDQHKNKKIKVILYKMSEMIKVEIKVEIK
jgi:hypothetical protein